MRNRARARSPARGYEETRARATRDPLPSGCTNRPSGRMSTENTRDVAHEPIRCFLLGPLRWRRQWLMRRRHAGAPCRTRNAGHRAKVEIGGAGFPIPPPAKSPTPEWMSYADDVRWPPACDVCGYLFAEADERSCSFVGSTGICRAGSDAPTGGSPVTSSSSADDSEPSLGGAVTPIPLGRARRRCSVARRVRPDSPPSIPRRPRRRRPCWRRNARRRRCGRR